MEYRLDKVSLREKGVDLNPSAIMNPVTLTVSLREKGVDLNFNIISPAWNIFVSLREKGVDLNIYKAID